MNGSAVEVVVALLKREDRYFLQRRDPGSRTFPSHWEFPGGKIEAGESPMEALLRELNEEIQWMPDGDLKPLWILNHRYVEREIRLHAFLGTGSMEPCTSLSWGWFSIAEMGRLQLPEASRRLIDAVSREL